VEPTSPEKFYIVIGTVEVDGKKGMGKVKKWYDDEEKQYKERILAFDEFKGEKDA